MNINSLECCAMVELTGTSGKIPTELLREFCDNYYTPAADAWLDLKEWWEPFPAFVLFSGVTNEKHGSRVVGYQVGSERELADYIRKNKLGKITTLERQRNRQNEPGHRVRGYVWYPHTWNLRTWYKKNVLAQED